MSRMGIPRLEGRVSCAGRSHWAGAFHVGLTSPEMCDAALDAVVTRNNAAAAAIMAEHGVPTVDLHAAIVGQCGAPPNPTCFNHSQCFCPHCPGVGYQFLAEHVLVPAIRKLLPARREEGPAFLVEEGRQRVAPVP